MTFSGEFEVKMRSDMNGPSGTGKEHACKLLMKSNATNKKEIKKEMLKWMV